MNLNVMIAAIHIGALGRVRKMLICNLFRRTANLTNFRNYSDNIIIKTNKNEEKGFVAKMRLVVT